MLKNSFSPIGISSLASWLNHIEHLHSKNIELGLSRVSQVANRLSLLHPAPLIITVGGTNGKGTTCRMLEIILLSIGKRVGVYSSPHLLRYTERVRIQGNELPENTHIKAMEIIELGRGTTSLSYFEFITLTALQIFKQAMLDIIILEVGLGGALDATNVIDADIAVITSIGLDHTNLLGPDRASIAREKAGICRRDKPIIVGDSDRPLALDNAISEIGAVLYARNYDWWWCNNDNFWHWYGKYHTFTDLPIPSIPIENAATALAVIDCLPFAISESVVKHSLCKVSLPGRFQFVKSSPLVILDVAHNPHAAAYLSNRISKTIKANGISSKVRAIVGMQSDKDIAGTLGCLNNQVDAWYCASLSGSRAASAKCLASYIQNDTQQFQDVVSAWCKALTDAAPNDLILVFGSFQTVAPVLALLKRDKYL